MPPSAADVLAVNRLLPTSYRLPLLVLDGTGMRVGELEMLTWGVARWVGPPGDLFAAVVALCPRDDRVPERPVFDGFGSERFRRALAWACTGAGIALFSPHDLRHRRVSLLHRRAFRGCESERSSATPT